MPNNSILLLICTWFLKNRVWKIKLDELDFLSNLNLNFAGYTGSKNQVQNSIDFSKIKCISIGGGFGESLVAPKWEFEFRNDSNPLWIRPDCGCYSKQNWSLFYEKSELCLFYKSNDRNKGFFSLFDFLRCIMKHFFLI